MKNLIQEATKRNQENLDNYKISRISNLLKAISQREKEIKDIKSEIELVKILDREPSEYTNGNYAVYNTGSTGLRIN